MTNPSDLLLSLAEHDSHACFVFNTNTNEFIYVNPAFYSFFQLPEQELTLKMILEMVHPDDLYNLYKENAGLQPGVLSQVELRVRKPDKSISLLRAYVLASQTPNDERIITGYFTDVSNRDTDTRTSEELMEQTADRINAFSHDLAGILASIQTYTLLLSRKTKDLQDEDINAMISSLEQLSKESVHLIRNYKKLKFMNSVGDDLLNNKN
jgi:two-component system sensor histidine kinase VicK